MSFSNPKVGARLAKQWFWFAVLAIVSVVGVATYFDTFSGDARAAHRFLRTMPEDQIREIRLEPYTVSSLTDHAIVIRDPARISRIATLFRGLQPLSPNHPHARWVAFIRFQLADRQYGGQIEATTNQGGIFWFASHVEGGWNYGCYRNDAIIPYFEQLAAEPGVH